MEERIMLEQRKLSNDTFKSLLSFFLDNERVTLWNDKDLQLYGKKEEKVFQCKRKVYENGTEI